MVEKVMEYEEKEISITPSNSLFRKEGGLFLLIEGERFPSIFIFLL
jgi:hypothetical protein